MKHIALMCGILISTLAVQCLGYPPDFGPFRPEAAPTNTCVHKWVCVSNTETTWLFKPRTDATSYAMIVQTSNPDSRFDLAFDLTIAGDNGSILLSHAPIPGQHQILSHSIYSGMINDDQIPDYVVRSDWGTGMGILGWHHIVVFVLSGPHGAYRLMPIESWYADPVTDLVDIDHDGRCDFIQTSFLEGGLRTGGKRFHNYWVHNLLQFQGTNCVPANRIDTRFPSWVWYKFKPNHDDDPLLPVKERARMWREQGRGMENYPQYPFSLLEKDQVRQPPAAGDGETAPQPFGQ